jgi:ribulose-phosphate 3-epimerase
LKQKIIAPSILSADFSKLGEEIHALTEAGADWIHVDVMDGHFVPNLTIGAPVVKSLKKVTNIPLDVHLMISSPEKYISDFAKAGAHILTFHVEATQDPQKCIDLIKSAGMKVGMSLRPGTKLKIIRI